MDNQVHNAIVNFIWGIADDCLRDIYVRGKYRDVILPMTVIRRLDAMLEDTKPAVLEMKKMLDDAGITNQWPALCNAAGQAFCNASPFRLRDLTSRAKKQTLKVDFEAYLDGFSPNVQEILAKFQFKNQIDTMIEADILGAVIEKFVSPDIIVNPEMDLLSIILNDLNDMFGNINWNDADNVRRQILEIPDMVAKDERYQNAMKNSDEQNARMESERALQQVIFAIMADNMELFKQFQDNPSFKKWLSDLVFNMTYEPQGKKQGAKKTINYSDYQAPASKVAEETAPYGTDKK